VESCCRVATAAAALLAALLPRPVCAQPATTDAAAGRLAVRSLEFEGVQSVDESALRAELGTRESPWLPWRARRSFDPVQFEGDLKRIVSFYDERGFPAARVVSHDVEVDRESRAVDIRIVVDEGPPLLVVSVELERFDALPRERRETLKAALALQPGEPLDRDEAIRSQQIAADALRDHGYPFAEVSADRRDIAGGVRIMLRADPGQLSFFGPIHIAGNVEVDDEIIRRELAYRPGELYRASRIRESLRRLESLELFRSADVALSPPEPGSTAVATTVTVDERNPHRFQVSGGFSSDEALHGEAAWRHVNFVGGGRQLGVRGRLSWLDSGGDATFVQPYFLTRTLSLGARGHAWFVDEPSYRAATRGGQASVAQSFGATASVTATYARQYQSSRIADEAVGDPSLADDLLALGLDPETGEQSGLLSTLALDGVVLRLDDPADPRRGYAATLRIEQAGGWLSGDYRYASAIAEIRGYVTPQGGLTFAARARYGTIDPFRSDSDIPFFKRFFLGGATSLRGWGHSYVAPLSSGGLPIGGHSFLEASAEVRSPSWNGVGLVGFVDAGQVWRAPWTMRAGDLLYDAGPGLRYSSPFGLVRLDFAYQLKRLEGLRVDGEPQTRRWRVQFAIGHAF
jgi:outer membrane protein assembly complex protein YaeT